LDTKTYLGRLKNKYQEYFDLKEQPAFFPFPLDLYAHFYQNNEKFFGSKRVNLWRMTTDEHCFLKIYDSLDAAQVEDMVNALKLIISYVVKPSHDHMKTILTGVIITNNTVSSETIDYIEKFRYSQSFKFYLHGWCDLRLILINLSSGQVFTNKAGKEVLNFYQKLLED